MNVRKEVLAENVTLWLGDCADIVPELGLPPDLVLTDPPYGVTYQSNARIGQGSKPITNDGTRLSLRLYKRLLPHYVGCPILWFTRWDAWPDVYDIFGGLMKINGLLVWDKGHNGMGDLAHFGNSHEFVVSAGPVRLRGSRDGSVLTDFAPVPPNNRNHPTEKPAGLLRYLIEKTSDVGAVVADPFMGSGTTGVAAVRVGRGFQGIECDPDYFDTACRRISDELRRPRLFAEPIAKPVQEALFG